MGRASIERSETRWGYLTAWSQRPRSRLFFLIGLGVVAGLASMAVNTFPAIGNDSVVYLEHSMMLSEEGWLNGFRLVGYPLYLAGVRLGAGLIGLDALLAAALIQRLLMIAGGVLAWRRWRWWSLPLITFLLTAETIAYTNFLLVEGLAIGLCILIVFPSAYLFAAFREQQLERPRLVFWLTVIVGVMALALFLLKFTYVVFAAIPALLVVAGWRSPLRRHLLTVCATLVVCLGFVTVMMSIETKAEHGVFIPATGQAQTRYYYAWMQVFRVNEENRENPDLASFYNDGQFRDFIRSVDSSGLDYREKVAAFDEEIAAMFAAADMSARWSQVQSMIWATVGGRVDDVSTAVEQVTSSTRWNVHEVFYLNQFALDNGIAEFDAEFNGGEPIEAVITDPIGWTLPLPQNRVILLILMPLAVVALVLSAIRRPRSLMALAGLLVLGGHAVGVGVLWADNLRFVVPVCAFALAVTAEVLRRPTSPTSPQ